MGAGRAKEAGVTDLEVVEICAGAGGQALGLERAGFEHALAVELDAAACATLRANRPGWKVAEGDVADPALWRPQDYQGVALLAGGVPCPPFTVAGRQLGAADERDLFAWAVELCGTVRPRALLLENVRGLSTRRVQRVPAACAGPAGRARVRAGVAAAARGGLRRAAAAAAYRAGRAAAAGRALVPLAGARGPPAGHGRPDRGRPDGRARLARRRRLGAAGRPDRVPCQVNVLEF
jgi:C-5 cytosine-specific DNA methylase